MSVLCYVGHPGAVRPGHVVCVWLDALTNYLPRPSDTSMIRSGSSDTGRLMCTSWARRSSDSHSVIWPAVLMSLGLPLPKCVFGHGWWTVEGEKMSKSKGERDQAEGICR